MDDEFDENEDNQDEDDEKEFSQSDVDELIGKRLKTERGRQRRAALKELAEELGVEDLDELKTKLAKADKPKPPAKKEGKDDPQVDEAELREEISRELKKEFQRDLDERDLTRDIEAALIDRYKVSMKEAAKLRKLVELDLDADEDEISGALDELEEEMPNLFRGKDTDEYEEEDDEPRSRRPNRDTRQSNPGRSPRRPRGKGADPKAAARTLLHERHPQTKKQTQ